MRVQIMLCGLLLLTRVFSVAAGEKITMKATPEISFAPAHLTIRTHIEADVENRAMEIVVDSADFYRSSMIQLDGDQAPRTSVFEFRDVSGGAYQISARLLDQRGRSRAYVTRVVDVIAQNGDHR